MTARRVAIVTGAARGIGAATVAVLARQGYAVLCVDSCNDDPALGYPLATVADLDAVVKLANDSGDGGAAPFMADVRDLQMLEAAVAEAERRWGGVDAAIACAGAMGGGAVQWESSVETERVVLDVNLDGVLNLARVTVPAMLNRPAPRTGRFIAIASAGATRGLPKLAAYCAAKAGITGFIRALAVELGDSGITANAVSPGSTDTAMLAESARLYDLASPTEFAAQAPQGRLLHPDEVAAVVAFLASRQSGAMTGAIVPVDAGLGL
ncbi:MAG TPA: mycofactocin-coupled SDR family oxidoreductase [Sporichthya sp.]|nr:mycofactocin-coupled SDR family oxidoreductase [Sporichthya sp.]